MVALKIGDSNKAKKGGYYTMKKICLLISCVLLFVSCTSCDLFKIEPTVYYSYLAIRNESSRIVTDISVDAYIPHKKEKEVYMYDTLQIGAKSHYLKVLTGKIIWSNVSHTEFIYTLIINYTIDGISKTYTVFDDGMDFTWEIYENLTEEELEKVYLKKDTNNTIVISDEGVTLLQGQ